MFNLSSIEGQAYIKAKQLRLGNIQFETERFAASQAFGVAMPEDEDEFSHLYASLLQSDRPFDPEIYDEAYNRAYLEIRYPTEQVASWLALASPRLKSRLSADDAFEIATVCEAYFSDLRADGRFRKQLRQSLRAHGERTINATIRGSKASGLGKVELRRETHRAAKAALELAAALQGLRNEALRPGQAHSIRGEMVRGLYLEPLDALIARLAHASDATIDQEIAKLSPKIEIDQRGYSDIFLPWEGVLFAFAQRLASKARDDKYWRQLPQPEFGRESARRNWVKGLGKAWERVVSSAPTFTDSPNRSPFMNFLAACLGHMAGLSVWNTHDEKAARKRLRMLDIDALRSAPTYKEDFCQ